MIKNKRAYKELILRRDICRFILKIRLYLHTIFDAEGKKRHRLDDYLKYFEEYGNLTEELCSLMTRAKVLKVNPNYTDEYQNGLAKQVQIMYENCTDENREEINKISQEITTIKWLCHDAKTLCSELMILRLSRKNLIDPDILKSTIITLLKDYVAYDPKSREYEIASEPSTYLEWYTTYFFKSGVSLEDHVADLERLFSKTMEGNATYRQRLLSVINLFQIHNTPFSKEQMIYMIENDQDILARILLNGGFCPSISFNDYLDNLFDELRTGEKMIPHKPGSPFAKEDIKPEDIASFFQLNNLAIFQHIFDGTTTDMLRNLAQEIAELPEGDSIASSIAASISLAKSNTRAVSIFENAYLEADESLHNSRQNLTFVLKQIADKKSNRA